MATFEIDSFRIIKSLHTTARQLFVCSGIIILIGKKQIPKDLLKKLAVNWSDEISKTNEIYIKRKGKLTEGGKATTSFEHYIQLCESLNLIVSLNGTYSITRSSEIYLSLLDQNNINESFNFSQKAFFFHQLLTIDADGILLALQILTDILPNGGSQKDLQNRFKNAFNERLITKQNGATDQTKSAISEQYRLLNFSWQKPEKYSEHLLIPRYEWLSELDLVTIERRGGATNYTLSNKGQIFLSELPSVDRIKDINHSWLYQSLFGTLAKLYYTDSYRLYQMMGEEERFKLLGYSLRKFKGVVKLSTAFRYPLFDALFFVSISHFSFGVITEFSNTLTELRKGFVFDGFRYDIFETGRSNESYVSIKLV